MWCCACVLLHGGVWRCAVDGVASQYALLVVVWLFLCGLRILPVCVCVPAVATVEAWRCGVVVRLLWPMLM